MNQKIARHVSQSEVAIKRCWQQWIKNGRYQSHNGSSLSRTTVERQDWAIVRTTVASSNSLLSNVHRVNCTYLFNITHFTFLRMWNLWFHRNLLRLPLTPVHRRVRLECQLLLLLLLLLFSSIVCPRRQLACRTEVYNFSYCSNKPWRVLPIPV